MDPDEGVIGFGSKSEAYDSFIGRYSRQLAPLLADAAGVESGRTALDVGCGPGALTGVLVDRLGAAAVSACDPSEVFVAECASRHPGVDVRQGRAEAIPFGDGCVDTALAQLVLHFVSDPAAAAGELRRVVRPGGVVAACVWDEAEGLEVLHRFCDAALAVDSAVPADLRTIPFSRPGELTALFAGAGLRDTTEITVRVTTTYTGFEELWAGFVAGSVGPAGVFFHRLPADSRAAVRAGLFERVGAPRGAFELAATARCAVARVPG
jgi:SAM-dependent methyltransferase